MALKRVAKKNNVVPMFSKKDLALMASKYNEISLQIKVLEEEKKALSDKIKEGAEKLGVKDDCGSYYLDSDNYIMGKVASKSIKIDQTKAVEVLKKKGLSSCVDTITIETVNEEKLEQAVSKKEITLEEVEEFTDIKVSYKVSVKKKEEMPEVEQSRLAVAKKK